MACNEWNDLLLEKLYGEIDGDRLAELERHVEGCERCAREMENLQLARQALAGAMPAVPEPPRVILLEGSGKRVGGLRMFAAGFAAATILLAAGMAAGLAFSQGGGSPLQEETAKAAGVDLVDHNQLDQALDARDARLMNMMDQRSGQVQNSLTAFSDAMEARRREDLRLVLGELITTEMWTGRAIHENRESLRHLTLAGQPGVTQW